VSTSCLQDDAIVDQKHDTGFPVRMVQLGNNADESHRFHLDRPTRVHIIALGEGIEPDMADYGWIENTHTSEVVWALTWCNSRGAGGASKNRLFDGEIVLEGGDYAAHFKTDHSHAWNDWNATPPENAAMWGMTVLVRRGTILNRRHPKVHQMVTPPRQSM
jgi:hypothetical protein